MDTIQVPFHEGHVFSPDGWQATLYDVRDNTKLLSERHANFANTIEHTIVRELEGVRAEIKQHIAAVEKEASALADEVTKEVRCDSLLSPHLAAAAMWLGEES